MHLFAIIDELWNDKVIPSRSRWKSYRSSARMYARDVLGYADVERCPESAYLLPTVKRHEVIDSKLAEKSAHVRRNVKNEVDFILRNAVTKNLVRVPATAPEFTPLERAVVFRHGQVRCPPMLPEGYNWRPQPPYKLAIEEWPKSLREEYDRWERWLTDNKDTDRPEALLNGPVAVTIKRQQLERFFGYLRNIRGRKKLGLRMMIDPDLSKGFALWHSNERFADRPVKTVTETGRKMVQLAKAMAANYYEDEAALKQLKKVLAALGKPTPIIDKDQRAAGVTIDLMLKAARSEFPSKARFRKPGSYRPGQSIGLANYAGRGLAMMMLTVAPLRNQNFRGARIGKHLIRIAKPVTDLDPAKCRPGRYKLYFTGDRSDPAHLKIRYRDGALNKYETEVPEFVAAYVDVYLDFWRPLLARDPKEDALFLNRNGKPYAKAAFNDWISSGFMKWLGKRINPHLCRDITSTEIADETGNINAAAAMINDNPATFWNRYNRRNMRKAERVRDQYLERLNRKQAEG